MPLCLCIKQDNKQCTREASNKQGHDHRFCWQHQQCSNIVETKETTKIHVKQKQIAEKKQKQIAEIKEKQIAEKKEKQMAEKKEKQIAEIKQKQMAEIKQKQMAEKKQKQTKEDSHGINYKEEEEKYLQEMLNNKEPEYRTESEIKRLKEFFKSIGFPRLIIKKKMNDRKIQMDIGWIQTTIKNPCELIKTHLKENYEIIEIKSHDLTNQYEIINEPPYTFYMNKKEHFMVVKPSNKKNDVIHALKFTNQNLVFSIDQFISSKRILVDVFSHYYGQTEKPNKYRYYQSLSDGNFWRFSPTNEEYYDKGYNYATTTMVNFDLQLFLFNEINDYQITNVDSSTIPKDIVNNYAQIADYARFYDKPEMDMGVFTIMDNTMKLDCHTGEDRRPFQTVELFWYLSYCYDNLEKHLSSETNPIHLEMYQELKQDLVNNNVYSDIRKVEYKQRFSFMEGVYKSLGELFNQHMIRCSDPTLLIANRSVNIDGIGVALDIYKVFYISKSSDVNHIHTIYVIYYVKCKWRNMSFKTIVYAAPYMYLDAKNNRFKYEIVTEYGLDEHYVSAGMFIYKIAEYKEQLSIPSTAFTPRSSKYKLVGFNDMPWLPEV